MKLPLIEAMKTVETGKVVALTPHLSITKSITEPTSPFSLDRAYEVETNATLSIRQLASDSRELSHLHKQAERMIMTEVYGPVRDRLRKIQHALWEEGPMYDDNIADMIGKLMDDLDDR